MIYVIYKKDDNTGTSSLITRGVTPSDNETLENLLSIMFNGEYPQDDEIPYDSIPKSIGKEERVDAAKFIDSILSQIEQVSKESDTVQIDDPRIKLQEMLMRSVEQQEGHQEEDPISDILNEVAELKDNVKTLHAQLIATMRDKALVEEECERLRSERDRIHAVLGDIISRR